LRKPRENVAKWLHYGKWEMGNGKWEMGKWEMGNGIISQWDLDLVWVVLGKWVDGSGG